MIKRPIQYGVFPVLVEVGQTAAPYFEPGKWTLTKGMQPPKASPDDGTPKAPLRHA